MEAAKGIVIPLDRMPVHLRFLVVPVENSPWDKFPYRVSDLNVGLNGESGFDGGRFNVRCFDG